MFFGAIEPLVRRERRRHTLATDLLALAIDVDVEPLLGDVVGLFARGRRVVIVPNDLLPLAADPIF
jgi:hypothetical protein